MKGFNFFSNGCCCQAVVVIGSALLCAPLFIQAQNERPEKPNVVLFLTDDLGWQDVKCYDVDEPCPFDTPNLDSLSKKGVLFTRAYSPAPTCAPSRSAIMSGVHPGRAHLSHVSGGNPPTANHIHGWTMMDPWYYGRGPTAKRTLPYVLRENGYLTGHVGKWHMGNYSEKAADEQGFTFSRSHRGATLKTPDRSKIFGPVDEKGFPVDQNFKNAVDFLNLASHQEKPFFFFMATWLVHAPIHTRSRQLLEKYCKRMNVPFPKDPGPICPQKTLGQKNPYYGAMVETMDDQVGKVFRYLEETEDPRWKGHKLIENTYFIFTSDNGGMEGDPKERYTDNAPLKDGKMWASEGGIRVPMMIVGPGIATNVRSDVVVNGLDFYPTILSWTHTARPAGKVLDGADLSGLLAKDPKDPQLVHEKDGTVRDAMVWHYPHGCAMESALRIKDLKLIRKYGDVEKKLQLYRVEKNGSRSDWEEAKDLSDEMPEETARMFTILTNRLEEMQVDYPLRNPDSRRSPKNRRDVPSVTGHEQKGDEVIFRLSQPKAKIVRVDLIYLVDGNRETNWLRVKGIPFQSDCVRVKLPKGATHFYLNLIDENNYLVSYPRILDEKNPFPNQELFRSRALRMPDAEK